jgi:hypothetical protein
LGVGIAYVFGIPIGGKRLLEGQYYWFLYRLFSAAAFIALPARKGRMTMLLRDIAAFVSFGICMWFSMRGTWCQPVGQTAPPLTRHRVRLVLTEFAPSGGIPFLLVVFLLGLYPIVADFFPGCRPYGFDRMIERARINSAPEGMMGITTKVTWRNRPRLNCFAGVLITRWCQGQFLLITSQCRFGKYRGGQQRFASWLAAFGSLLSAPLQHRRLDHITIPTPERLYPAHYAATIRPAPQPRGVVVPSNKAVPIAACHADHHRRLLATIMVAITSLLFYFGLLLRVDAYAERRAKTRKT